jgi:hypothetical protein
MSKRESEQHDFTMDQSEIWHIFLYHILELVSRKPSRIQTAATNQLQSFRVRLVMGVIGGPIVPIHFPAMHPAQG